jgi:hypothetical protein
MHSYKFPEQTYIPNQRKEFPTSTFVKKESTEKVSQEVVEIRNALSVYTNKEGILNLLQGLSNSLSLKEEPNNNVNDLEIESHQSIQENNTRADYSMLVSEFQLFVKELSSREYKTRDGKLVPLKGLITLIISKLRPIREFYLRNNMKCDDEAWANFFTSLKNL